jgi:RNA polymerase sigma-70 factor (ECF subfamily)
MAERDEAVAASYDEHRSSVLRYLLARCQSEEDALDLAATVFERSLIAYRRGEDRATELAWLLRVAHNLAVDLARRRKVQATAARFLPRMGFERSAEQDVVSRDEYARVRAALATLPRSLSDPIALRYAGGLSTRDVARVLGRSDEAIQKAIERGLRRLREALDA